MSKSVLSNIPICCTCNECPDVGHTPTMAERVENDSEEGWDGWQEHRQQVAERREQCMEGMV